MEICRQGLHDGHFGCFGPDNWRYALRSSGISVEPCRERRVLQRLEVALHTLSSPSAEVLLQPSDGPLGLQAERVPAEIDALLAICR